MFSHAKKMAMGICSAVLLSLTGCTTTQVSSATDATIGKTAAYSCTAAAGALEVITQYRDKLTQTQSDNITTAVNVINPVCSSNTVPTAGTLQATLFNEAMSSLISISAQVSGSK